MTYDQYVNKWNGKQITRFAGECVAGIAEYEAENNLPIVWGDAHTWINNPTMLTAYDWVANNPNDPNQLPPRGAIIIWPLPNEHIAFFDHNLANHQFMSFGQNSGGPAMHFQPHTWNNVAGWYVLKQVAPPTPVYTLTDISQKQIRIKQDTKRWNVAQDSFEHIRDNPVEDIAAGRVFTVEVIAHNNPANYDYYLENRNNLGGFNTEDCENYTPPPPPPEPTPPVPYIPPAAPVPVTRAETYTLLTALPYYDAPQVAINRGKQTGALPAGIYYVWGKEGRAYNLSTSNMTNEGRWVDTIENKAPVVVPVTVIPKPLPQQPVADNTWKTTRSWFYPDRAKYDLYELQEDTVVKDLDNRGKDWYVNAVETDKTGQSDNTILRVHGTVYKDGVKYYLLHPPKDVNWEYWYVIPVTNKHTGKAYLLKWPDTYATTPKKNQVTAGDEAIAAIMKVGYKIFDVLSPRKIREWLNNK